MREIKWKGRIIRFTGFRIENDYVILSFGSHSIRIPLNEWENLEIKEVWK